MNTTVVVETVHGLRDVVVVGDHRIVPTTEASSGGICGSVGESANSQPTNEVRPTAK